MADVLLIEYCDFKDCRIGGQASFAKNLIKAYGNRLALVGVCTDSMPVGRWIKRTIGTEKFDFFGVGRTTPLHTACPFIPLRIRHYLALKKYMNEIRDFGIRNVFVQAAEAMFVIAKYNWDSVCYRFPGVKNEIEFSRYKWARLFKKPYEKSLFKALRKADVILASADEKAITHLADRSKGRLKRSEILQFPTRVDTDIFFPEPKEEIRSELGIKQEDKIIVSCGKLRRIKGWDFILQAFQIALAYNKNMKLIFVGDGEDRQTLENMAKSFGISEAVTVTGPLSLPQVSQYLNAADLFVVGSQREGWSNAMLEALACGKPLVSTDVSGASEMIKNGQNGYVVEKRDPKKYADAMIKSLQFNNASEISLSIASKYSLSNLPEELGQLWEPLNRCTEFNDMLSCNFVGS